ncbi:PHB depolymerase family esterase [Phenylobacterium sp.]|uniref:extracellular catalytic domain type 1 short-chain-length polyhydroxyalkanoate depolymerase n=1 Tax=Phenylobacterium sp. TaxID=1871053 RepID=UPI002E364B1B|nr:PHB depolymerase family esterase [Phenylobacterium sp.]HEX2559020.1 PHB depolymerase family esterase [Phenylobacterium sp.]
MPKLGETIARLRRAKTDPAADTSAGLQMQESTAFGPNPGALRMLSYVPEGLEPGAPLVIVLHGCTQRAQAYASNAGWLTLAERCGFAVLAPEQSDANNPNRCFNWFEPQDAARGRGEAASIRAMAAHAVETHGLDPQRVFVTGLSAGGAMTSVMLAAYPEAFAGGAIVAGLPFGIADNVQTAFGAMRGGRARSAAELGDLVRSAAPAAARIPRVTVWHGDADHTVNASNATEVAKQWVAAHGHGGEPDGVEKLQGRTRVTWRSPDTGEVLVESNIVPGRAHGAPLATLGAEGLGAAAPFMLEAGVSSTLEIARFWGIAPPAEALATAPATDTRVLEGEVLGPEIPADASVASLGAQVMTSVEGRVSPDVAAVISRALKSAGLMK